MIFLAKFGVGVMGAALVTGAALSSEGFIHVKVHEKQADGTHINIIAPAALVPIALRFVPGNELAQASRDVREYLPIIDAAIPALEDTPDGVLVEVVDHSDHVLITKSGGSIVVDVGDSGDTVHVSIPLRAAQSSIHQLAAAKGLD
jgi:hypothetical protein